jgi:septum formation protein
MPKPIILASGSAIRANLLRNAVVEFEVQVGRIDEESIRAALEAEQASPRDIADTLAEMKARKISEKRPEALVIGCDQVLDHRGKVFAKPRTPEDALTQLRQLRDDRHALLSAVVIYEAGQPVWRHVGQVRLQMRNFSDEYLTGYVERNWDSIRHSVGGYKLEEEGVRLFNKIEGDYFTVLGLPLIEMLNYLTDLGELEK